jgi:hypothetical protein
VWKEAVVTVMYYPDICLKGLRIPTKSLRVADVRAEIRNGHLQNTSQIFRLEQTFLGRIISGADVSW